MNLATIPLRICDVTRYLLPLKQTESLLTWRSVLWSLFLCQFALQHSFRKQRI